MLNQSSFLGCSLLFVLFGFTACNHPTTNSNKSLERPEFLKEYKEFASMACKWAQEVQDSCRKKYAFNTYEKWFVDQEKGTIEFSDSGVVKLRIKYQQVGSLSHISNTWL